MERLRRLPPCILGFWPGLPQLWRRGSLPGLAQALAFALLLQVSLVTTLIWPESVSLVSRCVVWFCVLGFWLVFASATFGRSVAVFCGGFSMVDGEHLLQTAQREYLRGNWYLAERPLQRLLELDAGDIDARLMLSSLYRHAGRYVSAEEQLGHLAETHGGEKWQFEISRERALLVGLQEQRESEEPHHDDSRRLAADAA